MKVIAAAHKVVLVYPHKRRGRVPNGTWVQGGNCGNHTTTDAVLTEPIFVFGPCGKRSLIDAVGTKRVPGLRTARWWYGQVRKPATCTCLMTPGDASSFPRRYCFLVSFEKELKLSDLYLPNGQMPYILQINQDRRERRRRGEGLDI